ncbi:MULTISPECIES: tetratricopeptide repeat protein [unclassified Pseudomonas]|uniref:tetratricopeptide repeat protein n=1 Tax=unclassified Pseudomonas TaxID=196821 RepID=UPI0024482A3F|nr:MULTISPECIES: tetratricopeptide repeat protein [unclassified Pseudomonas]MDH0897398.1 sel1 repeat family protein [Pseudomonas sp. GD03875]MDH1066808.1 sel1 repeat family protein [Pseudomonas sp. GD03985]
MDFLGVDCVRRKLVGAFVLWLAAATGAFASPDKEELFRQLQVRAEAGVAIAQYNLGMFYNNGIGTSENPEAAFQWFEKAARAGDWLGSYKVGCYYAGQFGDVVKPDAEKALSYKLEAAQAGYVLAQHDVAISYARRGAYEEAFKWWQAAAGQGDLTALVMLSQAYGQGRGVEKSPAKAYEHLLIVIRLVPESQSGELEPLLGDLRKQLDTKAITDAEQAAKAWSPLPTELTMRAREGIREAISVAQSQLIHP